MAGGMGGGEHVTSGETTPSRGSQRFSQPALHFAIRQVLHKQSEINKLGNCICIKSFEQASKHGSYY